MIISIISYKGGVGKSTSAIHLAGCLARRGSTLLIDGDLNRSALEWSERGTGLPFKVVDEKQAFRAGNNFDHIVIDTAARPTERQLKAIIESSDKLIICTSPDAVSMAALNPAIADLRALGASFSILITLCPPLSHAGLNVREAYRSQNLQVYNSIIRAFTAYRIAAMNGCLVRDVKDYYAGDAWGDYLALSKEIK
jgi:chromosome partitioning protein